MEFLWSGLKNIWNKTRANPYKSDIIRSIDILTQEYVNRPELTKKNLKNKLDILDWLKLTDEALQKMRGATMDFKLTEQ